MSSSIVRTHFSRLRTFMAHCPGLLILLLLLPHIELRAQPDSVEVVAVHRWAAAQRTATGRRIATLFPWNGKLYAGYGDYGANTGPITIAALDPLTGTLDSESVANTEAIYNFRAIRGRLFGPSIDRKSYGMPGDFVMRDSDGVWSNRNCGSTTHAYDIVSLTAEDLWIVGSQDEKAAVFRSTDDGATWKTVLRDTAITGDSNDFARFYFAGVYKGRLYVQARDYKGPLHPRSKVFDGTAWSDGPDLFPSGRSSLGWRPDTIAGDLLYRGWEPGGQSTPLRAFNGATVRWVDSMWVRDVVMDSGYCHALVDSGYGTITIKRTRDLRTWTRIGRVPFECVSLAVIDGQYYLGTTDSKILRYAGLLASSIQDHADIVPVPALRVYPNPAHGGEVRVHIDGHKGTLRLVDLLGQVVLERSIEPATGVVTLEVAGVPPGHYIVMLDGSGCRPAALIVSPR